VHPLHAARGALTLDGKATAYGSATLVSHGMPMKTLVGLDGSFYFSDLPAGSYVLQAKTGNGDLSCPLTMPVDTRPLTDLGKIVCTRTTKAGS
jgi:outer membrane usher protein FimD/PapC